MTGAEWREVELRRRAVLGGLLLPALPFRAGAAATTPLRIGVLTDMSGPFASIVGPGAVEAARMAAEEFGEVLGRRVEILAADHQNKPDVGSAIARQWFDVDGVEAVAELVGSAVALAVLDVARERNRIVLVSGAGSSDITGPACGPTIFHWTWDSYSLARGTVKALVDRGGKDWFFLTADYAFGHAQERDSTAELLRQGGRVVGSAKAPPSTTDYSAFLLQAARSGANVLALATAGGTSTALKQAKEFGLDSAGLAITPLQLTLAETYGLGLETAQGALT